MVNELKFKIKIAAHDIGMNYSTAKFIIREHKNNDPESFNNDGKKIRKKRTKKIQPVTEEPQKVCSAWFADKLKIVNQSSVKAAEQSIPKLTSMPDKPDSTRNFSCENTNEVQNAMQKKKEITEIEPDHAEDVTHIKKKYWKSIQQIDSFG